MQEKVELNQHSILVTSGDKGNLRDVDLIGRNVGQWSLIAHNVTYLSMIGDVVYRLNCERLDL